MSGAVVPPPVVVRYILVYAAVGQIPQSFRRGNCAFVPQQPPCDEIWGTRRRYRLLALERLCWRLGTDRLEEVRRFLSATLQETMEREPCWTESVAVGNRAFLEKIQPLILSRRETEMVEEGPELWILKETLIPYRTEINPKSAFKAEKAGVNWWT